MSNPQILFILVYMALLVSYLFSETSGSFRRRAVNKIVLASLFALYSFHSFITRGLTAGLDELEMAAILFSFAGDCCLLWSFTVGGAIFSIGNFLFIVYSLLLANSAGVLGQLWWAVIPFALLWGSYYALEKRGILAGHHGATFVKYLATTTAQGCIGFALACAMGGTRQWLFGIGLALFMISDYFLGFHHFHHYARTTKWVLRCNSFSYFSGMLLIALSTGF